MVVALVRVEYGYLEKDALNFDGESTPRWSKTHFGMFWLFQYYICRCEVDGFVVASEESCR